MPRLERLALALLILAAACSKKPAQNYRNCLKVRIGMTREQLIKVMGEPEETIPYVEGKSLPHLKGQTAYEWRTPTTMAAPNHISFDEASGKVGAIRCGDSTVNTVVLEEAPASTSPAVVPAAPPPEPAPDGTLLPGTVVFTIGSGATARRVTAALGTGKFLFQTAWMTDDGSRMLQFDGVIDAAGVLDYAASYSVIPPAGKTASVQAKGQLRIPASGEIELMTTRDGPVRLSAASEGP